jgi:hypothetical protein
MLDIMRSLSVNARIFALTSFERRSFLVLPVRIELTTSPLPSANSIVLGF